MCHECDTVHDMLSSCDPVLRINKLLLLNSKRDTALAKIIKLSGDVDRDDWPIQLQEIQSIANEATKE